MSKNVESTPIGKVKGLIQADKKDLFIFFIYSSVVGLLSLAIPLATQVLVNTIAAGIFIQPLIVMSLLLLVILIFITVIQYLELSLIETIQQKIFVRIGLKLAKRIPEISMISANKIFMPELANRFFDVLNIQKNWAKFLLTGFTSILQIIFGLILIAFYSPFLLIFDLALIFGIFIVVFVLGKDGLKTSLVESTQKYKFAHFIQDMTRSLSALKVNANPAYFFSNADQLICDYLYARKKHFRVYARQFVANYILFALATTGVFAIGGWLVINRQLTLGQLIASEIVIFTILNSFQKIVQDFDRYYDFLTGMEKLSHLVDFPITNDAKGLPLKVNLDGLKIKIQSLDFSYDQKKKVLNNLNLYIDSGEKVTLFGSSNSGKTTLANLIMGFYKCDLGSLEINDLEIGVYSPDSLWNSISLIDDSSSIIEGTIEENIILGKSNVTHSDLLWSLEVVGLKNDLTNSGLNIKHKLLSQGVNISKGLKQKILIARGLVSNPKLLILDNAFSSLNESDASFICDEMFSDKYKWTVINITYNPNLIAKTNRVLVLDGGSIIEDGNLKDLISRNTKLKSLLPNFSKLSEESGN